MLYDKSTFHSFQVIIKWPNHFTNDIHRTNKLLNEIEAHQPEVDIAHEDATGQPPHIRSRELIPNVNGITLYQVAALVDRVGGNASMEPPEILSVVPNIQVRDRFIQIPIYIYIYY